MSKVREFKKRVQSILDRQSTYYIEITERFDRMDEKLDRILELLKEKEYKR